MKTIVVIPTYNEADNIVSLIAQILHFYPDFDILVVDDNSPDGTGGLLKTLSSGSNRIKLLQRQKKSGLGRAYVAGFQYVLSQLPAYERIIQMDADFSHHPKYLHDLIEAAKNKDVSIGSRYITGGGIVDWDFRRRGLSYMANLFIRIFLRLKIKDCTSGFRCFHRDVLANINLETIRSNGYFFQIEIIVRCLVAGYSIIEIPIVFAEREKGKSKLGFYEIWEAFCGVMKLLSGSTFKVSRHK